LLRRNEARAAGVGGLLDEGQDRLLGRPIIPRWQGIGLRAGAAYTCQDGQCQQAADGRTSREPLHGTAYSLEWPPFFIWSRMPLRLRTANAITRTFLGDVCANIEQLLTASLRRRLDEGSSQLAMQFRQAGRWSPTWRIAHVRAPQVIEVGWGT